MILETKYWGKQVEWMISRYRKVYVIKAYYINEYFANDMFLNKTNLYLPFYYANTKDDIGRKLPLVYIQEKQYKFNKDTADVVEETLEIEGYEKYIQNV